MATVTRENIGLLHEKLTVTVTPADYKDSFEKNLKQYAKTANIPGFRKGMVPAGLIKKMHGQSVFIDEMMKTMEKELNSYLFVEKLNIFAQPLPIGSNEQKLDVNNLTNYSFDFEIGLLPEVNVSINNFTPTRYKVTVTDAMIDDEIARLQTRHGNMTEPETVESKDTVLNVTFTELDAEGNVVEGGINKANSLLVKYFEEKFRTNLFGKKTDDVFDVTLATAFEDKERETILADLGLEATDADRTFKVTITKLGLVEKAELNEAFFIAAYPSITITNETELRATVKEDIEAYFAAQASNQLHDQIYHQLVDHTHFDFPETFLKHWLQKGGEKPKSAEEAEAEYPSFKNSLQWTLVSSKLSNDYAIEVKPEDIKEYAKNQLLDYMGGQLGALGDNQQWIDDYADRMMKDKKFVEESYQRISTEKLFAKLESEVVANEESIDAETFASKLHHHHH